MTEEGNELEEIMAAAEAKGWRVEQESEEDFEEDDDDQWTVIRVLNPMTDVTLGDWQPANNLAIGDVYVWRDRPDQQGSSSMFMRFSMSTFDSNTEARIATLITKKEQA